MFEALIQSAIAAAVQIAVPPPAVALAPHIQAMRDYARGPGEALWPGYGDAPFSVLLIEPQGETLLCHPRLPQGFTAAGPEPITGCPRAIRARSGFGGNLLAAMPIFGPPATIVMGTPEATGLATARWRATVLHEHMHQWQWSLPNYYVRVAALDLAGGDQTGMWMLNFSFPYAEPRVVAAATSASLALADAVAARRSPGFAAAFARYLTARRVFAAAAGERNWRYMELQLWQEGVARWTEIALARRSPDPEMRTDAEARERQMIEALRQPDLPRRQREIAYPYGAAEAMLMEACGPEWRRTYPDVLALGPLIEAAGRRCAAFHD